MKTYLLNIAFIFLSFATYSQDINKITALDTVYIYFEEDGKHELRNDKMLNRQSMLRDSLVIYEYNLKGTGFFYNGEFGFINKNFNDSTAIVERPVKISKKDFKQKKDKLITIKFFIEQGYRNSFNAIYNKKAIFIIEKKKDKTYTIMNAEHYFTFPYEE